MKRLREKLKNSYFIVNKIYLFLLFILLLIQNLALGFYYFIISFFIYIWKLLNSKIPMEVDGEFIPKTYVYKETKYKDLKLDIYYPQEKREKYPLVYFCHGGAWVSGFRNQANNVSWCRFLASKGLAVVSIDYRYGYKNNMEDILSDYSDGLEYVRENSSSLFIDRNNIVLMGLSAGGHLSLLYSTYHSFNNNLGKIQGIKGVVSYYSPANLNHILEFDNKSLFAKLATRQTLKDSPSRKSSPYDYYSPINWLGKDMVPTLLVHGRLDKTVPFKSSLDFAEKLKSLDIDYSFLIHNKGDHSFDTQLKDRTTINILRRTIIYIRQLVRR